VSGCVPCPPHGTCADGKLTCDPKYLQLGRQCVADRVAASKAHTGLQALGDALAYREGDRLCGITQEGEMNLKEAKAFVEAHCASSWGDPSTCVRVALDDFLLDRSDQAYTKLSRYGMVRKDNGLWETPELIKYRAATAKRRLSCWFWHFIGYLTFGGTIVGSVVGMLYLMASNRRRSDMVWETIKNIIEEKSHRDQNRMGRGPTLVVLEREAQKRLPRYKYYLTSSVVRQVAEALVKTEPHIMKTQFQGDSAVVFWSKDHLDKHPPQVPQVLVTGHMTAAERSRNIHEADQPPAAAAPPNSILGDLGVSVLQAMGVTRAQREEDQGMAGPAFGPTVRMV